MAVYFIPTGYAGGTILVNDGDVFIFEAGASTNIAFESASSLPADFAMDFSESKISAFTVEIKNDLNADITIADDVSLDNPCIKASNAASTDLTIGNNVTLDRFEGSGGTDTVTIGDNFVTKNDFKTGNGDDAITIDNNATAPKFDAGGDDDTVTFGENFTGPKIDTGSDTDTVVTRDPGATVANAETILQPDGVVDGTGADDTIKPGYTDFTTVQVDGEDGLDDAIVGYAGNDTISGGDGNDTIYGDYANAFVAPPPVAKSRAAELYY